MHDKGSSTGTRRRYRPRLSLAEEQRRNENAKCKVIGLTLETRPDTIDAAGEEVRRLRALGCTRVQLGVQHTDEGVLRRIRRRCTTDDARRAIRRLKDACYKVDIHLMPNLPGATPAVMACGHNTESIAALAALEKVAALVRDALADDAPAREVYERDEFSFSVRLADLEARRAGHMSHGGARDLSKAP